MVAVRETVGVSTARLTTIAADMSRTMRYLVREATRRDIRCCRKNRGRPEVSNGRATHPTVDAPRDSSFQDSGPYYQSFTYANLQSITSKNTFYKKQKVFG